MKHTRGEGALFFVVVAALSACADPVARTVAPPSPKDVVSQPSAAAVTPERAALNRIARLVAEAMDNEPARQHLKRDMRAAPFREHKLELTSYLESKDGKALLTRMAALNGDDEAAIFTTLQAIRPLEFYMPVAKHRESWKGKEDVLVVAQLDQWTPIIAFDEAGKEVSLDRKAPPSQPTLSLIPVETRFDQPMDPTTSRNVRDENGEAIGTLEAAPLRASGLVACGEDCSGGGGGGGGSASVPTGLYLEFSRILDMKEPWFRGDPEIEVHIQGPSGSAPTYADDLSCSGEHPYDTRKYFDQNTGFWEGQILLYSEEEIAAFFKRYGAGFHIMFWEDDNQPCTLKLDANPMADFVKSAAQAFGSVAFKFIPNTPWKLVAVTFVAIMFSNPGSWLMTNDDFLGVAIPQYEWKEMSYPDNTHVIVDQGNVLNGRANIVMRP